MSWQLKEHLQQLLQQEQGAMVYPPGSRELFALLYPNTYGVGMSNLGLHIIYQQINQRGDTACERAFLPDKRERQEYIRTNTPLLTIENQKPLYEFPLIGFAVSFEMDYFNIIEMLNMGKITLYAAEREETEPLLIMGGPCATFNPEPMAAFFDVCIIGEGEETMQRLLDCYYREKYRGSSRHAILLALAQLPGIYVPRFYQHSYAPTGVLQDIKHSAAVPAAVQRQWVRNLDDYPAHSVIVTDGTEFGNMFLIEIARGCGRHCRFCMAGYCFRRPRVRSLDRITAAVTKARQYRTKVGLMGAAISDYPEIDSLCQTIEQSGMDMSVASLRADSLTVKLVTALASSGHRTITLAPEAGSARIRATINKGITAEHIASAVRMAIKAGIHNVRLYIMIGLPGEQDEDITAIATMAEGIKKLMAENGSNGRLTLSINPFIPKPFTPFQWLPMEQAAVVNSRLKAIRAQLAKRRNIELLIEPTREAYIQGVLARGDRTLAKTLLLACQYGGVKGWRRAVKETNLNEDFFLYRERAADELLPWQILDMGVDKKYLLQELQKARVQQATPRCTGIACRRCGVCGKDDIDV